MDQTHTKDGFYKKKTPQLSLRLLESKTEFGVKAKIQELKYMTKSMYGFKTSLLETITHNAVLSKETLGEGLY